MLIDNKSTKKLLEPHNEGRFANNSETKEWDRSRDELDETLDKLTLPPGFQNHVLRAVLRSVLEYAQKDASLDLLNRLMAAALKGVQRVPAESDADLENQVISKVLAGYQSFKDKPFAMLLPVHAKNEERASSKANEMACRLRKLLPANVWIFVGPSDDRLPSISVSWGTKLSSLVGSKEGEGDVLALICDSDEMQMERLLAGESWEDCVKRVNPNNDKPLALYCLEKAVKSGGGTKSKTKRFESFEPPNDYASEVFLQTHSGAVPRMPIKVRPKIGRNDPCPCNSGKKWKKCCMGAN